MRRQLAPIGKSTRPSAAREKAHEVEDGLSELEHRLFQVRHLALAARMMGSSDDMPKEPGSCRKTFHQILVDLRMRREAFIKRIAGDKAQ
jgi:hypothetical protein